ncbi:MAG: 23S rRNA (pseudouridine(1915)-N(3))-methyltransferase RlmH [Acidobacteria bacterium]|nr:MAG: 23S rRNA (pseudouridine(1915)-N(3))-methyltransferase RlmH [Acidobacteriota bacterium]
MPGPLIVLTVGRAPRGPWREIQDDYAGRIARHVRLERRAVRPSRARSAAVRRREETRALLAAVPERATRVAFDATGTAVDSPRFARRLADWLTGRGAALIVGGPDGLDREELEAAGPVEVVSLGRVTLPHELALVVVLEQVYRALAAAENHPYGRH